MGLAREEEEVEKEAGAEVRLARREAAIVAEEAGTTRDIVEVTLDIAEGPRKGDVFAMRQISLFDTARTRQMHILTTRTDLPAAQIRYRMGSRWRQENHYS